MVQNVHTKDTHMQPKRLLNLLGDRLHSLPLLILYITDGCNSRCRTCDIWRNPRRNMAQGLVDQLVGTFAELGIKHVLLSGGEAMQHPQWDSIAAQCRAAGARVMLLTNGLYLQRDAARLSGAVDEVIVSLDGGTAPTYAHIRGVDAFDLVLDGIRATRQLGIPVTTRTTVQRDNFRELPQIIDVALAAAVNTISFLAVDVSSELAFGPRDAQTLPASALTASECTELAAILSRLEQDHKATFAQRRIAETPQKLRRTLLSYFQLLAGEATHNYQPPPCNAPHFSTVVEVDGTLRPCYFLPAYGRLQPQGPRLQQAINSNAAQALRNAYRTGQRTECAHCVCPLHKSPRALVSM
jgi:Fe-coproporphyrin III synthase